VYIGDRTLISPDVCICTGTHPVDMRGREEAQGTSFAMPIVIEADCWIGARVTILPDVRIGRDACVAAGAVVTKDVEPEIVGGDTCEADQEARVGIGEMHEIRKTVQM
jgi:acetyltransferase-like isoleucine patch superfamily enzyme